MLIRYSQNQGSQQSCLPADTLENTVTLLELNLAAVKSWDGMSKFDSSALIFFILFHCEEIVIINLYLCE